MSEDIKVSEDIFIEIINYMVGIQGTGYGELSAILFKSGKNNKKDSKKDSKKAGDININNELIEVKAQIAKLQNTADTESGANYADGRRMMPDKLKDLNLLINKRKDLIDKVIEPSPDELTKPVDEKKQLKAKPVEIKLLSEFEPTALNIGKVNLNGRWLVLKKLAIENGLTDPEFARWFVSLFYTIKLFTEEKKDATPGIWKNASYYEDKEVNQLIKETEAYFSNSTHTDEEAQSFLNILGWHSLLYYQKCDKFKKLLYADIVNNSIIIYDPRSGIGEFLQKFKIVNGPTWKDGGTNSCFKLKSI
jgi:hypothetical protein